MGGFNVLPNRGKIQIEIEVVTQVFVQLIETVQHTALLSVAGDSGVNLAHLALDAIVFEALANERHAKG